MNSSLSRLETPQMIFVCVFIVIVAVLAWQLWRCQHRSNFCLCNGLGKARSSLPNEMRRLYAEGKITEYTFPPNGHMQQPVMPYDQFAESLKPGGMHVDRYLMPYDVYEKDGGGDDP